MSHPTPPVVKNPGDTLLYTMDFSLQPEVIAGDTVVSCVPTVSPEADSTGTVTVGAVTTTTTSVSAVLSGGTDGNEYDVRFPAVLVSGRIRVLVGSLLVRAGPS